MRQPIHPHRRAQMIVTTCVVMTTCVAFYIPHQAELVAVLTTVANMVWIWIE